MRIENISWNIRFALKLYEFNFVTLFLKVVETCVCHESTRTCVRNLLKINTKRPNASTDIIIAAQLCDRVRLVMDNPMSVKESNIFPSV